MSGQGKKGKNGQILPFEICLWRAKKAKPPLGGCLFAQRFCPPDEVAHD